jgi:hypothetical protein
MPYPRRIFIALGDQSDVSSLASGDLKREADRQTIDKLNRELQEATAKGEKGRRQDRQAGSGSFSTSWTGANGQLGVSFRDCGRCNDTFALAALEGFRPTSSTAEANPR